MNCSMKAVLSLFLILWLVGCGGGDGAEQADASLEVPSNAPPIAVIGVSASGGQSPVYITFDASASSDADGHISSYAWDFGDGSLAQGEVVSHEFDAGAEEDLDFTVRLTVTDDRGGAASTTTSVAALKNGVPSVDFNVSVLQSQRKVFLSSASADPEGGELLLDWDLGDGSSFRGENLSHTYAENGRYRVTLTADDQTGRVASHSSWVTVNDGNYSVSGTVKLGEGIAVDTDTNDASSQVRLNNSLERPQRINTPISIAGFVTAEVLGSTIFDDRRFTQSADPYDVFLAGLQQGQRIQLDIANSRNGDNDLDLLILDGGGNLVDYSLSAEESEVLEVSESGEYFVVVKAHQGYSNYSLSIVSEPQSVRSVSTSFTRRDRFVAGEVLARPGAGLASASVAQRRTSLASGTLPAQVVAPLQRVRDSLPLSRASGKPAVLDIERDLGVQVSASERKRLQTIMEWKRLRASGQYDLVDLNRFRYPTAFNDPYLDRLWHYSQVGVPEAWSRASGEGVIVAVIDTGIVSAHEEFIGQLVPGYDFISDPLNALDGDGIDPDPEDLGDDELGNEDSWHGTHVAGTVAAAAGNARGILGVAHGARIMPLRALGVYGGSTYDVVQAIYYAAGLPNDSGQLPERRADVINLSLAGAGFSVAEQDAVNAARAAGVIVVAAAGNSAENASGYSPAGLSGVVTVSAVGRDGQPAPYTNFGASVDIAAPGGNFSGLYGDTGVLSAIGVEDAGEVRSGYAHYQGTSMAAPHVAGVVALMKQLMPEMTPVQFDQLLADYAVTDRPVKNSAFVGAGLLNAERALDAVTALAGGALPERLFFEGGRHLNLWRGASAEVELLATGDSVEVTSINAMTPWLSAELEGEGPKGLGVYRIAADLSGLVAGSHQGVIRFVASNGTSVDLRVSVAVTGSQSIEADPYGGAVYAVVVDVESGEVGAVVPAVFNPELGLYDFRIEELDTDLDYYVFVGSDNDSDGVICEVSELCAALAEVGELKVVGAGDAGESVKGIDLTLGLQQPNALLEPLKRR